MTKLIITFEKNLEVAKSILSKMHFIIYKNRLNALMKIISKKLKNYKQQEDKAKHIFIEEGTKKYIEKEKIKLENFLFSESESLIKDPDINKIKTDRLMQIITSKIRKAGTATRNKAVKTALMGNNVIGFFNKTGIGITWKIE